MNRTHHGPLAVTAAGVEFQNPIVLAAGTAAYGREIAGVVRLNALGGLVTKAVSVEPRTGAPAPRVADFGEGMINAVGLQGPGVAAWLEHELPPLLATGCTFWIAALSCWTRASVLVGARRLTMALPLCGRKQTLRG